MQEAVPGAAVALDFVFGKKPEDESHDPVWWQHERLHRSVLRSYPARLAVYSDERDRLEAGFIAAAQEIEPGQVSARASFSARCFEQAGQAEAAWLQRVNAVPPRSLPFYYQSAWQSFDRQAKLAY